MLKQFENYLIARKYRQVSANNSLSTVFDYCYRISKICEREGITIEKLAAEITKYLEEYSVTGNKAKLVRAMQDVSSQVLKVVKNGDFFFCFQ